MQLIYVKAITLLELIITILIVAILVTIGLPHFNHMRAKQESQSVIQLIKQSLQFAKQQAALSRTRIVICPSNSATQCNNNQWSQGFIIFTDANENNQVDHNEMIYVTHRLNLKYGELRWQGALNRPNVFFNAQQGLPNGSNGSFYYCSHQYIYHKRIILSRMGQVRYEEPNQC